MVKSTRQTIISCFLYSLLALFFLNSSYILIEQQKLEDYGSNIIEIIFQEKEISEVFIEQSFRDFEITIVCLNTCHPNKGEWLKYRSSKKLKSLFSGLPEIEVIDVKSILIP